MSKDKDIVEKGLDTTMNATKSVLDGITDAIGTLIGANSSKSDDKDEKITVTKHEDGSTTVHIPKGK